jgi:hypothetical protein
MSVLKAQMKLCSVFRVTDDFGFKTQTAEKSVGPVTSSFNRRHFLRTLAAVSLTGSLPAMAQPVATIRVIMMEEPGCRYCAAWDRDVGHRYATTPEGVFAPLVRVRRGAPELAQLIKPATYTPTFIVMNGDKEVGRITGYPGEGYFWEELKEILTGIGFSATQP